MIPNKIHKTKKALGLKTIHGFARAKKALGQNFLKSELALNKIVEAGEIKKGDIVLEIGPGRGALTKQLLGSSSKVLVIEKDKELIELLREKFKKEIEEKKLILVEGDILEFNTKTYNLETRTYKVIANIPYNITGAILKKFLTAENQPELMALMVQHEVAKRIIARDKKESLLSISVKAYGEPKMIMKVGARYFSPSPKVDSAIISIKNISRRSFEEKTSPQPSPCKGEGGKGQFLENSPHPDPLLIKERGDFEAKFWKIVRAGFAHKRKKLSSNLKTIQKNGSKASVFLDSFGDKRAEDLTFEDWIMLTKWEMSPLSG